MYDDGCHLKKFATNPVRSTLTNTAKRIGSMEIVVDKMHFRGHVDDWCKCNCNPNDFDELKIVSVHLFSSTLLYATFYKKIQVDTEVCEQTFSWLSRYSRISRHMNRPHFMFYLLYVCELHNRKKLS